MNSMGPPHIASIKEKKHEDPVELNISGCVYCLQEFTDAEQSQGKVNMFLAEGCFHQFHIECFQKYAKKQLLTKLPSGDFGECRCKRCNTLVEANELREALGLEFLQNIREQ